MSAADSMIEIYVFENMQLLEQLEFAMLDNEKQAALNKEQIDEVFRVMHTVKGSSAMMGYDGLTRLAHSVEDVFSVLRQNKDIPAEAWPITFDLVLECIDFFKAEITKVQDGLLPDGEFAPLRERAVALNDLLLGKPAIAPASAPAIVMPNEPAQETEPAKAPEAIKAPAPETPAATPQEAPAVQAKEFSRESGLHYYHAKLFFAPGCAMESVRAFAVVNSLEGMYQRIAHIPEDLGVNCDEEIITNGLTLYIASELEGVEIEAKLESTMFLQQLEFFEYEQDQALPPALSGVPAAGNVEEEAVEPLRADSPDTFISPYARAVPTLPEEEPAKPAAPPMATELPPQPQKPAAPAAPQAAEPPRQSATQTFLSVNVSKVDKLMDLVGEIVTTESMVTKNADVLALQSETFEKQSRRLHQLTDELQDIVMAMRMVPVSSTFRKLQRIVRDMSKKTGKEVNFVLIGEQTEVDKNVVEHLSDPLMHMIRNSMDHGIESSEERLAAGKNEVGTITLEARNTGGDVLILLSDDGRGLDRTKLIKKAQERGLTTKAEYEITDREAYHFITEPGFSTKETVTEFSGRGVGMDVVCSSVEQIGGTLSIDSEFGCGTSFMLNIPLTLAIIDGMDVQVGEEHYIVPVLNMRESLVPNESDIITEPDGTESMIIRGQCRRIERLHRLFNVPGANTELTKGIMVLIETEFGSCCLFVDRIVGEQQVVVKPLPPYITRMFGRLTHISGCTILGSGAISMILDANALTGVKGT